MVPTVEYANDTIIVYKCEPGENGGPLSLDSAQVSAGDVRITHYVTLLTYNCRFVFGDKLPVNVGTFYSWVINGEVVYPKWVRITWLHCSFALPSGAH